MTPRNDSNTPQRTSGNPAKQQTMKQQRAEQRAAKVEAHKKDQARKARNKRVGIITAITAAVAVIAFLVVSIIVTLPRTATYTAGSTDDEIKGVETFTNGAGHVETPVTYPQSPPAGGQHNPAWLNCGIYTEPQQNENAVHSLEHGAIWVTYDADELSDTELETLKTKLPSSYVVLSPYEGEMPTPLVLSAWNAQLALDSVSDERIGTFFEKYWKSEKVPEPGALCSGAVDGPGKV